jgi:hypothetical protein
MTPSQLPVGLRIQQTIAAYYRAGYPIEEIADAIALAASSCEDDGGHGNLPIGGR